MIRLVSSMALLLTVLILTAHPLRADYTGTRYCVAPGALCSLHSENFYVNYDPRETTDAYADWILVAMEQARSVIIDQWGFEEPTHMKAKRLIVHIQELRPDVRGLAYSPAGAIGVLWVATEQQFRNDAVTDEQARHLARATAGHELFHLFQSAYLGLGETAGVLAGVSSEVRWLIEATASWAEQHLFTTDWHNLHLYGYFLRNVKADHWRLPVSANAGPVPARESAAQRTSREQADKLRAYRAALFFQYLTENHPRGNVLIRDIFDRISDQTIPDVWAAILGALGQDDWGGLARAYLSGFAVAALTQSPTHHSDLSFDQLGKGSPSPQLVPFDPADPRYQSSDAAVAFTDDVVGTWQGETLLPIERSVYNLAFDYVELAPFPVGAPDPVAAGADEFAIGSTGDAAVAPASVSDPVDITVTAQGTGEDWAFFLVEIPLDAKHRPRDGWTVTPFESKDGVIQALRVESFGPERRVVVVAANLQRNDAGSLEDPRTWRLSAAVVEPLVVTKVELTDNLGGNTYWTAERKQREDGGWDIANPVTTGLHHVVIKGGYKVSATVVLSRPAEDTLTLQLGDLRFELTQSKADGTHYSGVIDVDSLVLTHLEGDTASVNLPVVVHGHDARVLEFDANPLTPPELVAANGSAELRGWEGDGIGRPGGPDNLGGLLMPLHRISLPPYLMAVTVTQEQDGGPVVVYDAAWKRVENLSLRRLDVMTMGAYDPSQPATLELRFSAPMRDDSLEASLEPARVTLTRNEAREVDLANAAIAAGGDLTASIEGTGYIYTGEIPGVPILASLLESQGYLELRVAGSSVAGTRLDTDPADQAYYDWVEKAWSGYDPGALIDGNHRLTTGGRSFVLLLDASNSMGEEGRLADAKSGILSALRAMKTGDQAALIVFYGCGQIVVEQPFTTDLPGIWTRLETIGTGGGTPLGDATAFARTYLETHARYDERKLLVFSDGASNCGSSVVQSAPQPPVTTPAPVPSASDTADSDEPPEPSISWWSYRVDVVARPYRPQVDIYEIHYEEATGPNRWASLSVSRFPVSTASGAGRVVWSIGWTSGDDLESTRAEGEAVDALRVRADAMASGAVPRTDLNATVEKVFGNTSEALAP